MITNTQTTLVLQSSANFGAPSVILPLDVIILPPGFDPLNPLALGFEYQQITGNVPGTNTLTIANGVRAAYAGTTPRAFGAGATVAAALLAEGLNLLPQRFANQAPSTGTAVTQTIPSLFRHVDVIFDLAVSAINTSVFLQLNADNGAHYYWAHNDAGSDGSRGGSGANASTSAEVGFIGTGGSLTYSGRIRINDIQQTSRSIRWDWGGSYDNNAVPNFHALTGTGLWLPVANAAVTSIAIFISGGAITSSNFDFVGYP